MWLLDQEKIFRILSEVFLVEVHLPECKDNYCFIINKITVVFTDPFVLGSVLHESIPIQLNTEERVCLSFSFLRSYNVYGANVRFGQKMKT